MGVSGASRPASRTVPGAILPSRPSPAVKPVPMVRALSPLALVLPDVPIDAFMADRRASIGRIDLHASGNLFRGMLLAELGFDIADRFRGHFIGPASGRAAFGGLPMGLLGPIAPLTSVASQFPTDGAAMHSQVSSDLRLTLFRLLHGVNLNTIFLSELSIVSHQRSP